MQLAYYYHIYVSYTEIAEIIKVKMGQNSS